MSNYADVINCYNIGDFIVNSERSNARIYTGGIAATLNGLNTRIDSSYNNGRPIVTANEAVIACYPICNESMITCTNSYYLENDSFTAQTGSNSLTDSQLRDPAFMPAFNFEETWLLDPDAEYPYPQLRSNPQDTDPHVDVIELVTAPTKLEYRTGETISADGGVLHVYYIDGTERDITITEDMLSGYDMNTPGVQTVTIKYKTYTTNYKISVAQRPAISNVELYSGPEQTTFVRGTAFDFSGAVAHVTYVDGTSENIDITADNTTGGNINQSGDYTITFEYEGYTLTFDVKVVPLKLTEISIESLPDATTYLEGQELDPAGLSIAAHYNSGNITIINSGDYTLDYDNSAGTQTVTVTYQNKTVTFEVLFMEKVITDLTISQLPDKTQYVLGQPLDITGMIVTATYNDESESEVIEYEVSELSDTLGKR